MASSLLIALLAAFFVAGFCETLDAEKQHMMCGKRLIEGFRTVCNVASCGADSTFAAFKDIEQGISEKCCLSGCTLDYLKSQCCLRTKKGFGDAFLRATPFKPDKRWSLSRVPARFNRRSDVDASDWLF